MVMGACVGLHKTATCTYTAPHGGEVTRSPALRDEVGLVGPLAAILGRGYLDSNGRHPKLQPSAAHREEQLGMHLKIGGWLRH